MCPIRLCEWTLYASDLRTSTNYADPALMGILQSSLTPYNNDLYASNLAHLPLLVIHGSEDGNVPPTHSRAHVALVAAWQGRTHQRDIKLIEVPKKEHWWNDVFGSDEVASFMGNIPKKMGWEETIKRGFTLTTANPMECGGKAGIRIVELEVPGRCVEGDCG
jgi:hypothetical protein